MRLSAMNSLAMREHSIKELRVKLEKKFPISCLQDSTKIEQLLSQLVADNLLSDERFTEVFVRSRYNRGFGPVKISYELTSKGITKELIDEYLDSYSEKWIESIQQVWDKKFLNLSCDKKIEGNNMQERAKQSRFLYQRGFSYEQVNAFFRVRNLK